MKTFDVWAGRVRIGRHKNFESAARDWDAASSQHSRTQGVPLLGGIHVQETNAEGVMVQAGWLLHVHDTGHVYLNPNLKS